MARARVRQSWLTAAIALLLLAATSGSLLGAQEGTAAYHQSATDPVRAETSRECLECHDGSLGQNMLSIRLAPPRSNHPIGIDYLSRLVESPGRLKPIGSTLRLEAGTVGCVSCHDLASDLPAKLAMSNKGSALCLTCHNI